MERTQFDISDFYKAVACKNRDCLAKPPMNTEPCKNPLTMVFINMQPLESVYNQEEAFNIGTLFPNLNKPFLGGRRR